MPRSEVLLVGGGRARYETPLTEWAERLRAAGCSVTRTSPSTWYGEEVLTALAEPRDLVVFFGHGRPGAWLGYARLDAGSLAGADPDAPHPVVASLSCGALDVPEDGPSLVESAVDEDLATRFIGHEGRVHHDVNRDCLDEVLAAYRAAAVDGDDGVAALLNATDRTPLRIVSADERRQSVPQA